MSTIVDKVSVPCGRVLKYIGVEIIVVSRINLKEWLEENFPHPGLSSRMEYSLHGLIGERNVATCRLSSDIDKSQWGFNISQFLTKSNAFNAIKVEFRSSADKIYVVLGL